MNPHYVEMFFLQLNSLYLYGTLDENTDIVLYTSTGLMNLIKTNFLYDIFKNKLIFEINDTYNDIDRACKSRIDVFDLPSISKYYKILYLDTDIIITGDINPIFEVSKDDIIYVLGEGQVNEKDVHNYWGSIALFNKEEMNIHRNKTAFSSGIILFNNCDKVRFLFKKIKEDIVKRPNYFSCYDQPYFIYNAFKYDLYDNTALEKYVKRTDKDNEFNEQQVIYHFAGDPGHHIRKIPLMTNFFNNVNKKRIEN